MVICLIQVYKCLSDDKKVSELNGEAEELKAPTVERVAKINESLYKDEDAFMLIVNALPLKK